MLQSTTTEARTSHSSYSDPSGKNMMTDSTVHNDGRRGGPLGLLVLLLKINQSINQSRFLAWLK